MSETQADDNQPTEQQQSKSQSKVWMALVLVIVIVVASGSFWNFYQPAPFQGRENFLERVAALTEMQQQLSTNLTEQQSEIKNLQMVVSQLRMRGQADTNAWVLTEVDHLSRLADYRAGVDKNPKVALKLLHVAQQRTQGLTSPEFHALKQAIANGVSQLEAVPVVDVEKIIVRLNALSQTLGDLPLSDTYADPSQATDQQKETDMPVWRRHLENNLKRLQSVIVIRHLDKPSQALLPPQQHASLIESIQLQMSMAQWAVLQHNQEIYRQSLAQAMLWIKKYLRESTATAAIYQGLKELEKINVAPQLPSLASVVKQVEKAIQTAHQDALRQNNKSVRPSVDQPRIRHKNNQENKVPEKQPGREVEVISS